MATTMKKAVKVTSIKKDDIVEIIWEDASVKSSWSDIEEVIRELDENPSVAHSYGRVIHVSKKRIIISGEIITKGHLANDVSRSLCIPKRLIMDIRKLTPLV